MELVVQGTNFGFVMNQPQIFKTRCLKIPLQDTPIGLDLTNPVVFCCHLNHALDNTFQTFLSFIQRKTITKWLHEYLLQIQKHNHNLASYANHSQKREVVIASWPWLLEKNHLVVAIKTQEVTGPIMKPFTDNCICWAARQSAC